MNRRSILLLYAAVSAAALLAVGGAAAGPADPVPGPAPGSSQTVQAGVSREPADASVPEAPGSESPDGSAPVTPDVSQPDASLPNTGTSSEETGAGEQEPPSGDTSSAPTGPDTSEEQKPAVGQDTGTPSAPAADEPTPDDPQPPAQDTAPSVTTPPPTATDDYAIVTGTSGVFTPGAMVDDSWFDDALFIGDSRTDGLRLFCRVGKADYFAVTGLTVFNALTKTASDNNFSTQTLGSLLDSKTYGKVFICLGINECGSSKQKIINSYQTLLNTVREKQPGATVIIQSVMACGRKKAASSASFGPDNINKLNANIKTMAENSGVCYLDPNTLFADSEGYLPDEFSGDGCHFYAKYYKVWVDWIKCQVYDIPTGGAAPQGPDVSQPEGPAEPGELLPPTDPAPAEPAPGEGGSAPDTSNPGESAA